ncbi:MAG: enoyl-CoA hydratase-related protein, partial [Pseudomonadota bacterium]
LSRNISRKKTFEMLTTGRFIDAAEAERLGLINHSVPQDQLQAATSELADTIASKLGSAVAIGKRAFYDQIQMPLPQAYAYTGDVMVENMREPDTEEGIAAFLEKRVPDWPQNS